MGVVTLFGHRSSTRQQTRLLDARRARAGSLPITRCWRPHQPLARRGGAGVLRSASSSGPGSTHSSGGSPSADNWLLNLWPGGAASSNASAPAFGSQWSHTPASSGGGPAYTRANSSSSSYSSSSNSYKPPQWRLQQSAAAVVQQQARRGLVRPGTPRTHAASSSTSSRASCSAHTSKPLPAQQAVPRAQASGSAAPAAAPASAAAAAPSVDAASAGVQQHAAGASGGTPPGGAGNLVVYDSTTGTTTDSSGSSWEEESGALITLSGSWGDSNGSSASSSSSNHSVSQLLWGDLLPPHAAAAVSGDSGAGGSGHGTAASSNKLALLLGDTYPGLLRRGGDSSSSSASRRGSGGSSAASSNIPGRVLRSPADVAAALQSARAHAHVAIWRQNRHQQGWRGAFASHQQQWQQQQWPQRDRQPGSGSSGSSGSGSSWDEADWLSAVLSHPASRLTANSNAVLTNSLRRLATARGSGSGRRRGSVAAAPAADGGGDEDVLDPDALLGSILARFDSLTLEEFEELSLQLAKMGYQPSDSWLAAFDRSSLQVMPGGSPRLLSKLLLARAKLSGPISADWCAACLAHMTASPHKLSVSSWVNALWACVRLRHPPSRQFQAAFFASSAQRLDAIAPELLTHLVWSAARLRLAPTAVWWRALAAAAAAVEKPFSHAQLASLVHSVAVWCCAEDGDTEACTSGACRGSSSSSDSGGGLGGVPATDLALFLDMLLLEVVDSQLVLLQPAELTAILWSLGALAARRKHTADPAVLAALLRGMQGQLPRLSPQQCSSVCWGLARLAGAGMISSGGSGRQGSEAGAAAAAAAAAAAGAAAAAAAAAAAPCALPEGFGDALLLEVQAQLGGFSGGCLCSVMWALARLRLTPNATFRTALWQQLHARCGALAAQDMSTLLWALAQLQLAPPDDLLHELCKAVMPALPECDATQLTHIVWALARLGAHAGRGWVEAAEAASLALVAGAGVHELVNLAWGLCQLRQRLHEQPPLPPAAAASPAAAAPSHAWQAAVLRELRLRCTCAGHDTDCRGLLDLLAELGVRGFAEAAAAAADALFAQRSDVDEDGVCCVQFQPGCR